MTNTQSDYDSSIAANVISQFSQAQKQAELIFASQKELLDTLTQMNEHWFARARSEAELTTELTSKLASARSMPDVISVYQDWLSQRMQRHVQDSNHVLVKVQNFIWMGARCLQNGHSSTA